MEYQVKEVIFEGLIKKIQIMALFG